ncbi:putative Zn-dependent protease [Novosphingobium sp. 1529]|uniref:M48 family metalloprotease n=1 Tax=Novosphingobium sp. 1529 TaxID=3156424 RepID=UPI0033978FE9
MKILRLFLTGLLLASNGASAATIATEKSPVPAPYSGAYQPIGVDEIGLWHEEDDEERKLAASPLLIRDEDLTQYVKSVLCKTVGIDRCNSVRIYIIRTPLFNASMSPNGTMRVLSGLLLRVHNEAELGTVLGHEFGHFEKRHTLSQFKARRSGTDLLAWAAVLAAASPSNQAIDNYRNIELSVYGNLFRFSRDQEREADKLAISYLNSSSLPPQFASAIWENVMAEAAASASSRGLPKPNYKAIAFSASHPPDGERASYLKELADPQGATRNDGAESYRAHMSKWLPEFMSDQVKLNDFGASEFLITSWGSLGWTPWLWLARGDLYRTRGAPRDLINAIEFYDNAIALDPKLSAAYRGKALALLKTGQMERGQKILATYLDMRPEAPDAALLRTMIQK